MSWRRLPAWLVCLALVGCSGGSAGLLVNAGSLAGYVFLKNGLLILRATNTPGEGETPVSGAQVVTAGGIETTAADGFYHIHDVPAGLQTVTVTFPGALPAEDTVTVVAGSVTYVGEGGGPAATRWWTVLVYLNADNAREAAGVAAVNAMETVGSTETVTVLALMDRSERYDTSSGDWTGARRFVVEQDTDPTTMSSARTVAEGGSAADLDELDLADPAVLQGFLRFGVQQYPASHYLVIVWGAANGWRPPVAASSRALSADDSSGAAMPIPALSDALDADTNLDIVAFDGDFMQMLEVAYEARRRCDYVIGSQDTLPAAGLPLGDWLAALTANPAISAASLARALVDDTVASFAGQSSATLSAVTTAQLSGVVDALDSFAARLREIGAEDHDLIVQGRDATQGYGGGDARYDGYRDLVDLVNQVAPTVNDGTLTLRAIELRTALDAAVLREAHTGDSVARSHGLSIYFPAAADYLEPGVGGEAPTQSAYEALQLSRAARWDEWLAEFTARLASARR